MKTDQLIRTIEIRDRRGQVIGTKEVVTYQGLLSKAHDEGLKRIATRLLQAPTEENGRTAIAKAEVETAKGEFQALGDASPANVNSFIAPHLIRMAETRAKARALRDAVNIGVIAFEELNGEGVSPEAPDSASRPERTRWNGPEAPSSTAPKKTPEGKDGNPASMSEAQRRYLFRILAGQGLQGDAAHEYLKELLAVDSLASVTKQDATAMIDRLLNNRFEEAASNGTPQR